MWFYKTIPERATDLMFYMIYILLIKIIIVFILFLYWDTELVTCK